MSDRLEEPLDGEILPNGEGTVHMVGDEMLTEIEVSEEPPDDDTSTIWTDDGDDYGLEEVTDNPALDSDAEEMALFKFDGHSDSVYCAAVHPKQKGVVITGGGDDTAYIWKYDQDQGTAFGQAALPHKLGGHTDTITSVGFNFDGTLALTGAYDGTVRVWNVATGELKVILEGPEDVEWAEWHPKGNAILAGSKDGTVWMWLSHTGQCVQVFAGHDGAVMSGCFTKDGKLVCTGGDDGTVRIWAPKTGACKHVFEGHFGHEATVTCLVSSADGEMLLSGSVDGTVKLLQVSGKRVLQTFLHSARTKSEKPVDTAGAALPTPPGASDSRGKQPSAAEEDDGDEEGDYFEGDEEETTGVECVGFSAGAFRWAASGGLDQSLKVWDMVTGSCRCVCAHGGSVVALCWHSALPLISTAALDNIVRLWDARNGVLLLELTGHRNLVTNLTMAPIVGHVSAPESGNGDADPQLKPAGGGAGIAESGHAGGDSDEAAAGSEGTSVAMEVPQLARDAQEEPVFARGATDVIVSVSDDKTARVFHINANLILSSGV